jgi:hypothetical protein
LQVKAQSPFWHIGTAFAGALHRPPQPPQFELSVLESMHEPLQLVVPSGQVVAQVPSAQT